MENKSLQTSIPHIGKTSNLKQSKKGFKIQISSSDSFTPFTLSVYFRKSNSRIKVSLKHNQLFRENFNSSCSVQPKIIQLIAQ